MCKQGFFVSTQCHVYFYYLTFLVLAKQGDDYFILRYSQEGERKNKLQSREIGQARYLHSINFVYSNILFWKKSIINIFLYMNKEDTSNTV